MKVKYLIVNDNNDLYAQMFRSIFNSRKYDVTQIDRLHLNKLQKILYKIHTSSRINSIINLPLKDIWSKRYGIEEYNYNTHMHYCVIILNGALRTDFSIKYIKKFKKSHANVTLVCCIYDSIDNLSYKSLLLEKLKLFDIVFSFDEHDCTKYGFIRIIHTFSRPEFVSHDQRYNTDAFFAGMAQGRLDIIYNIFNKLKMNTDIKLWLVGVKNKEKIHDSRIAYHALSYSDELMYAYNTKCILEIVRSGQRGITLRTCEAVTFNKRLITNNPEIKNMPFYNPKNIYLIENNGEQTDDNILDFVKNQEDVNYGDRDCFSPFIIINKIQDILEKN